MIDELISTLPKNKKKIEKGYNNCEKLRKYVAIGTSEFVAHLEKAKSDLSSIESDFQQKKWDWVVIKAYYSIHHAINSLLIKHKGFYSKDHFCSIFALKNFELISDKIYNKLKSISVKFSDFTGFEISYSLRKIGQYDVNRWKFISDEDALKIYSFAKEFVAFAEKECFK
jgi:uncharacterized protein (UPF0332 family)